MALNNTQGKPQPKVTRPINHQRGNSIDLIDMKRVALPPGMRLSKNGKPYSESRKNRTDFRGRV
jgi:hypothetical protein